jgi:steroid delta-isomerase-like uncharacterized protein
MTRDDIEGLLERRKALWRARDPNALAADYADDAVVVSPLQGLLTGKRKIRDAYVSLFRSFPDWDYQPEETLIDGDRAAEYFGVSGTHSGELFGIPPSGRRFEIRGILLFRFVDLHIVREQRIYDFTGFLVQLGVLRPKLP